MRLFFRFEPLILLFALFFVMPISLRAQSCAPVQNFEASTYNIHSATYEWDLDQNAAYYLIKIYVNGVLYITSDLPGGASHFMVDFQPNLDHNDLVTAVIKKTCLDGNITGSTFDFIIVIDDIVYLIGDPKDGGKIHVEPIYTLNDNLVLDPGKKPLCGLCDPNFFRLTSGIIGPYAISADALVGTTLTMEDLRFDKTELCTCLNGAVNAGYLDPNGGPGPNFSSGNPYKCIITPYVFTKIDCSRGQATKERNDLFADTPTKFMARHNALNARVQIDFDLASDTRASLSVYDMNGKLMEMLVSDQVLKSGAQQFFFKSENVAAGLYFCTLRTSNSVQTAKIVIQPD